MVNIKKIVSEHVTGNEKFKDSTKKINYIQKGTIIQKNEDQESWCRIANMWKN